MSEKDKPSCAVSFFSLNTQCPTTAQFIMGKPHGHLTKVIYFIFFLPPPLLFSDYCVSNTAPATCHCLFLTCPRSGVFWGMSALFPVPVPEVGPCGLCAEEKRKRSVCSSSSIQAVCLSISRGLFVVGLAGIYTPGFTWPDVMSSWTFSGGPETLCWLKDSR